jgi:methionine-S-sulfoxide reductase
VVATAVGYSGGSVPQPTYRMVCGKNTGHAEVVLIEFDPRQISYRELLEAFFEMHHPGYASAGSQYRSAIFTFDEDQAARARSIIEARRSAGEAIATEVTPASTFWIAEPYHQQYVEKHGRSASTCGVLRAG